MAREFDRKIILEDGSEYFGFGFGDNCDRVCELVFNTSMAGYQALVTDPSYAGQAVVMTYPLIGNYGITEDDSVTRSPAVGGVIVREYCDTPSNFSFTKTLSEIMEDNKIPGVSGVDTRKLARAIRDNGTMRALITSADTSKQDALKIIADTPERRNLAQTVSCKKRWYSRTANHKYNLAVLDCGVRLSVVKALNKAGCNVTVLPLGTDADEVLALKPDGLFISNGPGSPLDVPEAIELVKKLRGRLPIYGLCLGCQIISLAYGAKIGRLKFGHRGANHPIKNLATGKIEIAAQNHSYSVDEQSLEGTVLTVTHKNLLDSTVEGVCDENASVFAAQYYPDFAAEMKDEGSHFARFLAAMKK